MKIPYLNFSLKLIKIKPAIKDASFMIVALYQSSAKIGNMDINRAKTIIQQNRESYNVIAKNFSDSRNRGWPELEFFIKNFVETRQGVSKQRISVLDIGCGNARLFELLKNKNVDYLGIDISEKLISEARRRHTPSPSQEGSTTKFEVDDILNLNYENRFDAVFCIAVLNHIPSQALRQQAMQNIYRALKPGGYLFMTNWNLWNIKSKKSWWKLKLDTFQKNKSLEWNDVITYWGQDKLPLYYHSFVKREMNALCQKSGFKIMENYYSLDGKKSKCWQGKNLLTVGQKQK